MEEIRNGLRLLLAIMGLPFFMVAGGIVYLIGLLTTEEEDNPRGTMDESW